MEIILCVPLFVVVLKSVYASCPSNSSEFLSTCYYLNRTSLSYSDAEKSCQKANGVLVRMKSAEIENFIQRAYPGAYFWMGLSDKDDDSTYEWADGTAVDYSNWTPSPSTENCVLHRDNEWQPTSCTTLKYFMCEHRKVYDTGAVQTGFYFSLLAKQYLDDAEDYRQLRVINSKMCAQYCLRDINECIGFSVSGSVRSCQLYRFAYGKTATASNSSSVYKLF